MITHVINNNHPKSKEILSQDYNFSIIKSMYKIMITIQRPLFTSLHVLRNSCLIIKSMK